MQGRGIFGFSRGGSFTLEEANQLVGLLNRITQKHSQRVDALISRLEALGPQEGEKTSQIEKEVNQEITEWNTKVMKLSGRPRGLWHVDIDAGDGYYCWKYPEQEIQHWHHQQGGHADRISLTEKSNANSAGTDQHSSRQL